MSLLARKLSKQDSASAKENRKSSAMDDPEWKSILEINSEVLKVWRLPDKGPAILLPKEQVGFFMSDEKYVVLKTSNHNRKLVYDLHFWNGLAAAQKMASDPPEKVAQVMALLDDNVVLHREISEFESPRFKSYFKEFGVLSGNVGSLFDPENPQKYQKRLLRFALTRNKKRIEVTEVPISRHSLNSNDVFIFDEGIRMTQWNGVRCDNEERLAARKYIEKSLKLRKTKCTSEFVDEEDLLDNNELYAKLGNAAVPPHPMRLLKNKFKKSMYRLSDDSKKLTLSHVYTDKVYRNGINPDDVTFVDTLHELFIYIGPGANDNERNSVWAQADKFLKELNMPHKSIAVFNAGCYCEEFEEIWDDLQR
ncbi:unnamed protein product [Taenia asiatica]|uniref:Gelsolin-like domain-containing protein n=1 Tax=Taenia asiatica TaxID=60517 RepID=A0A0R3WDE4_TAEAS|nr:unnamed protein product [Taenia asiatica]